MKSRHILAAAAIMAATLSARVAAHDYAFNFSGGGASGSINLTWSPNPNTGVIPGTSPNPVDPIGSYIVTGISGTFSDTNIGIVDAAITGIVPSNPHDPEDTNLRAPHSFGFYKIVNGPLTPEGVPAPGFSYSNLFYPGGSPQSATDYPFHGGFLDIYGLVFTIAGGNAVNLWSNGDLGGLTYGVGVTDGVDVLDYVSPVTVAAVPEPAAWGMMLSGLGLVGLVMRRRQQPCAA